MSAQRKLEHAKLEDSFTAEVGANVYQPYFTSQQKASWRRAHGEQDGEVFESNTENDYLTQVEARRSGYKKDKKLLEVYAKLIRHAMVTESVDPDDLIQQKDFAALLSKGVIDKNQAFLMYQLTHKRRMENGKQIVKLD